MSTIPPIDLNNTKLILQDNNMIRIDSIDENRIINPNAQAEEEIICLENNLNDIPNSEKNIQEQSLSVNSDPEKIYTEILDEIYESLTGNSEVFGEKKNVSSPDVRYENRKTTWLNFGKNCSQINRTPLQLQKFIESELAVETSIDGKSNLLLRGKYNFNTIANNFKKYIKNYVVCSACKSLNTEIVRNSSNRLDYLKCLNPKCNSCRVVIKIHSKK
jgi:translation initiation factor 2 subunit 2